MEKIWRDIRYALRMMRKKPGFALFAVLTLALGIGVNTVVFSVANAVLLRPLPAVHADELIRLYQKTAEGAVQQRFSYPDYQDLRDRTSSLQGLAAVSLIPLRLETENHSAQILSEAVSGNFFTVMGVSASQGRTISQEDDVAGARPVILLSSNFWRQHSSTDQNAVETTVRVNGSLYDVIGILPAEFTGTFAGAKIDAWIPLSSSRSMMAADWQKDRSKLAVHLLGRLKAHASSEQVSAELATIYSNLAKAYPQTNKGKTIFTGPATLLHGNLRKGASFFFAAIMLMMALVLLIACSNLAGMLVTRALERRRELAIRISLGANRSQVILQLFTESILIALIGGAAGFMIAGWFSNLIVSFWPIPSVPVAFNFGPDLSVFLFCFAISILTGVVLGIAPALQSSRNDVVTALKEQSNVSLFPRMRLKSALVVLQVGMSLLLLVCAALFVRSWHNAEKQDPGFDSNNILAMDIDLADQNFTHEKVQQYFDELSDRVKSLPGVQSVAYSDLAPMDLATARTRVKIAEHQPPAGQDALLISTNRISPEYFQTMRIQLLQGRDFQKQANLNSNIEVIINETMAQRYWPNENPIGRTFQAERELSGSSNFQTATIIGIAKNVKYRTPAEEQTAHFYVSFRQIQEQSMTMLVKTRGEPKALIPQVEKEISAVHQGVQAFFARSMEEHLEFSVLPSKLGGSLLGFFGVLGLLLASIGIYAAISFQISQRKREIGIRMAVGARPQAILRLFIAQGLKLTAGGAMLGIVAALLVTRLISSLLVGVESYDLFTFVVVPMFLMFVAFVACAVPSYRATKLDPLTSLRYE